MINDENTPDFEQDENEVKETVEETNESQEETKEESTQEKDWKAEALKYKAILDRNKNKKPEAEKSSQKSNDLDYGAKAYLTANGIKGAKEFDFVKNEMKSSGDDLDSLLENDYFKSRLEKFRSLNKTQDATPQGKRSGGIPTDSVEYWAGKPIEEVPQEMRIKVVNAKLQKETSKGVFYNS